MTGRNKFLSACAIGLAGALVTLGPVPAEAAPKGCPPGLAKKAVPCVPPGLAKKGVDGDEYRRAGRDHDRDRADHDHDDDLRYRLGDQILRDYSRLSYPDRYGLDRYGTYYRVGDYVYRVDPETKTVLDLVGLVAQVLN